MTDHIISVSQDGILSLTLSRPEKKNALTDVMYGALADGIDAAQVDPAIRVVLIRGEGDAFTAGNDIAEFAASQPDDGPRNVSRFLRAIATADKPLVAAVQGKAVGVGTTMLLHCDYVILADDAQLTTPFVSLGLVPEAGSSLLLPARVGHLRAFSMLAMGDALEARDAMAWGLANVVVPATELADTATAAATRIARQPLGALIATKKLMRDAEAVTSHIAVESAEFAARLQSAEAREAFLAFAQRRAPDFTSFR